MNKYFSYNTSPEKGMLIEFTWLDDVNTKTVGFVRDFTLNNCLLSMDDPFNICDPAMFSYNKVIFTKEHCKQWRYLK